MFVLVYGKSDSVSVIECSTLRLNALPHLRSLVLIARERTLKDSSQCSFAMDRNSVVIERINRLPYISSDLNKRSSVSLVAWAQCAVRLIAPLLWSIALAIDCHILPSRSIARYLRSSAPPQSAPADLKQLSFNLFVLFNC